jgi:hypothetical protein
VQTRTAIFSSILLASSLLLAMPAQAFDMGNMMNPSKWVGGDKKRDRYDDDYYDDYDYGPPPGLGYGAPGYGYGAPGYGGYGAPGYGGYGAPGYGGYGAPGYGGYGVGPEQGLQAYDYATPGAPSYGGSYTGPSYGGNYTGPSDQSRAGGGQSGYGPGVTTDDQLEIQRLKDRIRRLEQADKPQPNVWGN